MENLFEEKQELCEKSAANDYGTEGSWMVIVAVCIVVGMVVKSCDHGG